MFQHSAENVLAAKLWHPQMHMASAQCISKMACQILLPT